MANQIPKTETKKQEVKQEKKLFDFAFGRENYILMLIGIAVLVVGYLLLAGGGSKDFNTFNDALFDFRRLTLAPIVLLGGIIIEIIAIMKKPKDR